MHLHITTLLFIVLEHINNIFTQNIPISPCPKMFQYRFDGSEWFGVLSVRNPDFGRPLHLRVTLSVRGKPTTNYLGEIELLTRGQFHRDVPVLYRVKFPKTHFPPKLLQISTNNQVICLGAADHGIFVTQIQLEHTRKLTFIPDDMSLMPNFGAAAATGLQGSSVSPGHSAVDELQPSNMEFGTKHLSPAHFEKKISLQAGKEICGRVDERIRFQVFNAMKLLMTPPTITTKLSSPSLGATGAPWTHVNSGHPGASKRLLPVSTIKGKANIDTLSATLPVFANTDDYDIDENDDNDDIFESQDLPSITRGAWPWLAAIYVNNLTSLAYQCSGTIVSARVVISAAHCFQMLKVTFSANEVLVFLGRHNLKNWNEEGSVAAPVDDIFIHPDFDRHLSSYDADIAVLILKNPVRFSTFIRPACMWSGSTNPQYIEGEQGVVVGWGLNGHRNANLSGMSAYKSALPRIISAPIVSNDICFKVNENFRNLSSNRTFCAGSFVTQSSTTTKQKTAMGSKGVTGPCTGDSGAGLMIYRNRRWVIRGIVSATLPNTAPTSSTPGCIDNQYVIYTDVAKFLDWILAFTI